MDKIATVREQVQIEEWVEMVSECQNSGLSVRKWCMENGINPHTYYNRLRKVREAYSSQQRDIIPIAYNETASADIKIQSGNMMFGKSSEQLKNINGYKQLTFFNETETEYNSGAPEPTEETLVAANTRKAKRTQAEITENLEHREEIIDLPEDEKKCGICGEPLVCIGKEKLRSELNIVPAQVFVIDYYRYVYKCPECEAVRNYE